MLHYVVKSNKLMCLLDLGAMQLFTSPKVALWLGLKAAKVAKPIQVRLAQGDVTPTKEVMF